METVLFVDGRNFIEYLKRTLTQAGYTKMETSEELWAQYDFKKLFETVLKDFTVTTVRFYLGKLSQHLQSLDHSRFLIEQQRLLKTHLEQSGCGVQLVGAVRAYTKTTATRKNALVFKEKGLDVSIAVDMVVSAVAGTMGTAILGSSDSDLQPAVHALRSRGVEVVYLGFKNSPNKGLMMTCTRTILIRDSDVCACMPTKQCSQP